MRRRYAEYGPLTSGRAHRHLLRTARLNLVGWLALLLLCAMAGTVAALLGNAVGWPWWVTGACAVLLVLAGVVGLDRRRWAGMSTSFSWTDDPAEVGTVVEALRQRGLPVEMIIDPDDGTPRLSCRNRHAKRVQALIATLGESERRDHPFS